MTNLGATLTTSEIFGKAIRSGTVSLIVTDLTKAVTFASAMPSANYRVFLAVEGNLSAIMWPTSKATSGFTLNVSVGITGSVAYLAVEDE